MPRTPYILIADDDPEDQEMLIDLLQKRVPDADIKTVSNGSEVMQWLFSCARNELPSLILLDYKMPGLTGAEILEATEKDQSYKTIPKVIWSTSNNSEYIDICMRHGAVKYFTKPNDMAGLGRIVDSLREILYRRVPPRFAQ